MFGFLKKKLNDLFKKTEKDIEEKDEEQAKKEEQEKERKISVEISKEIKEDSEKLKQEQEKKAEEVKKEIEGSRNVIKITYFVHGTTTDNEKNVSSGWNDVDISEKGKKQSIELINQIKDEKFDAVFCSDLKRAVHSAELTFKNKVKIIKDKRLRECNYGKFNANPSDIVEPMQEKHIYEKFPEGESYEDVKKRVFEFLKDLLKNYSGKNVAILSHKAPQLALEVLLKEKTWEQAFKEDWRKKKAWQPGWEYVLKKEILEVKQEEKKQGFFSKIFKGFTILKLGEESFDKFFNGLEEILIENNVALEVIDSLREKLKKELLNKEIPKNKIEDSIKEALKNSISDLLIEPFNLEEKISESLKEKKPYVIVFFGINGGGKTTTIARLAYLLKKKYSVILAAADTFRAASIEQLEKHSEKLQVPIIKSKYGADPASVIFDAIAHAKAKGIDIVLADTAGRMHTKHDLLREMEKIVRVSKPDLKVFVAESTTGNDAVEQAKAFNDAIGIDALILTKADVDERGGAMISVSYVTGKPILFLGVGQEYKDLEIFDKKKILDKLFS